MFSLSQKVFFLETLEMVLCENPSRSSLSEILKAACWLINNLVTFKFTLVTFLPQSVALFEPPTGHLHHHSSAVALQQHNKTFPITQPVCAFCPLMRALTHHIQLTPFYLYHSYSDFKVDVGVFAVHYTVTLDLTMFSFLFFLFVFF